MSRGLSIGLLNTGVQTPIDIESINDGDMFYLLVDMMSLKTKDHFIEKLRTLLNIRVTTYTVIVPLLNKHLLWLYDTLCKHLMWTV